MKRTDELQLDVAKSTAAIAWGRLWHVTTTDDLSPAAQRRYVTGVGWCWMIDGEVIEVIAPAT